MAYKSRKKWLNLVWLPVVLLTTTYADFTTECQRPCDCRWQSGNKAAICSNSSLKAIPTNLSSDIQILDLSNNNLNQLHQEGFKKVGLSNLKKLFLKECSIETVHKFAFATLAIMIELDLSKNKIQHLHPDTFRGTEKLRLINLNNNFIDKLEDGLFRNLKYLQKVEVSNNRIVRIGSKTFTNLPQLKILRFDGNYLSHMKPETLMALNNLSGLDLHNNPWRCDCNLQTFRNWVISHNLYTPPTACAEPAALRDKLWNELESANFACRPTILEPLPDATVKSFDENVTLTCKVVANPTPEVLWRFNSKTIETRAFGEVRYVVTDNTVDLIRWVNLTILNARYSDRGNYTCVAENPGGRDEKTLILVLSKYGGAFGSIGADTFAILVGTLIAVTSIFLGVVAFCYCTSSKIEQKKFLKPESRCSNGEALIENSVGSDEKGFVTEVNPISKPPRKYDAPPSLTSAATEMSEMNRTLLDNESAVVTNDEATRQPEQDTLQKISQEMLLMNRLTQEYRAYPPDLLTFPLRPSQMSSPSGPEIQPNNNNSPLKSPTYGVTTLNPNAFSRFQVPSTSQCSIPLINPKGGYVTLPRRPRSNRQPDSTYPQVFSTLNGVIPNYDNFGMKLFGHGANYYSLNKSELDMSVNSKSSLNFGRNVDTSDEIEQAPSPAPGTPHGTLPRSSLSSPNIHNQLLALQALQAKSIKVPMSSEPRPLKVMLTPSENENLLIRDMRGNSINIVSSNGRTKLGPNVTTKTRKRNDMKEPFYNCSGDTATQV